jgi:AcrR family transcriptional regulator
MSPIRPHNPDDPRVQRTRAALRGALEALMAEKTFNAITVRDVASRAGVNRVTFYSHFRDKFELLEHAVRAAFQDRLRERLAPEAVFSPESLGRLIQIVSEFLIEMRGHCPPPHAQYEPLMEKQVKAELVQVLEGWLRRPGRGGPQLAAGVASWAIYGAAVQWKEQAGRVPWRRFLREVQPMIAAGLQAAEAASHT